VGHNNSAKEARVDHEGFEARNAFWKHLPCPFGIPADSGLSSDGEGEEHGASNPFDEVLPTGIPVML
jgi:hypothetical protein